MTLDRPTPIYTLVFLRVALGLLGAGDILGNAIYFHWYKDEFSGFTFPYIGFEWVQPFPEPFMSLFFLAGFGLGVCVALGWRFRVTAPVFAAFFTYFFLLEKAHYLNHAYLFCWLAWLLCLTPAHREWSLDVRRDPGLWSSVAPAWSVYLFPALMGCVYFFGGIAKINADWLLHAMPLKMWLARRSEMFLLGPLWASEITAYVMAWGGMLLDLTAGFMLLHRRLRWVALGLLLGFHATNHLIFNIGIFPYLSMVLTSMFFRPDWPKLAVERLINGRRMVWARSRVQGWKDRWKQRVQPASPVYPGHAYAPTRKWIFGLLAIVFLVHLALPFRHWSWKSDVNWSEQGHRYSWRMMLRSKQGRGNFRLVDKATGETTYVNPSDSLSLRQYRKMATHPDMILQYAHHLRDSAAEQGRDVAVHAEFRVRLNGRRYRIFIDPEVDLAGVEWDYWRDKDWILGEETSE